MGEAGTLSTGASAEETEANRDQVSHRDSSAVGGQPEALVVIRAEPLIAATPDHALGSPITPTVNVYVRSNFPTPKLARAHRVRVHGSVEHPFTFDVDELQSWKARTVLMTMECAGNDRLGMVPVPEGEPWNRGAVSTIEWTGVSLADVLDRAGISDDAVEIIAEGADAGAREGVSGIVSFARALPVSIARDPDTIVAYAMNGKPLTAEHGAPMRLVVPRWYGMASVKWLSSIAPSHMLFEGHFQTERYVYDFGETVTPVAEMRVKSIVVSPVDNANVALGTLHVTGWAWTGSGEVTGVEVSLDEESWTLARLEAPVAKHAWRKWSASVNVVSAGKHTLRSRATDSTGATQPTQIQWNRLGYGNNAIRSISISAR